MAALLVVIILLIQIQTGGSTFHVLGEKELFNSLMGPYSSIKGTRIDHKYAKHCKRVSRSNEHFEVIQEPGRVDTTYESKVQSFSKLIGTNGNNDLRNVSGHVLYVSNPLEVLSVLEPYTKGTCNQYMASRALTTLTLSQRDCYIGVNAGFFDSASGACFGNIISDGRIAQESGGIRNSNFGIREDGSFVFGYLNEETVRSKTNPFVQMVSGVGWLIRRGENYVNQSLNDECVHAQSLTNLNAFANIRSARTAIGHDVHGRIIIAQVDGKTGFRGVNLDEFADLLKSFGAINAINLDGGGSATFVVNGKILNEPSDVCTGTPAECERKVSTILCIRKREKAEPRRKSLYFPECSNTPQSNCNKSKTIR